MRTVNDYSNSDKPLATRAYNPSGVLTGEVRYTYDDEGRLIAERHIDQAGRVSTPTTYAYGSEGRKTKTQECDFSGDMSVMIGIEDTHTAVRAGDAKRVETRY